MIEQLAGRFGWRGLYLMVMGSMWALIGVSVIAATPIPPQSWVLYQYAPTWVRGPLWILTGGVAIWKGTRGRIEDDSAGHGALYIMPAVRGTSNLFAFLVWLGSVTTHQVDHSVQVRGFESGILAAVVWLAIIVLITICARWPNPLPVIPTPPGSSTGAV